MFGLSDTPPVLSPKISTSEHGPGVPVRFVRLFTAPRDAFAGPRPASLWLVPLLVMVILSTTQSILLRELVLEAQMERIAGMSISQAQRDAILDGIEAGSTSSALLVVQSVAGAAFSIALWYLFPALLYWLGLSFGLGVRVRFGEVLGVTMLTALLHVFREMIRLPMILANGSLHVYTGPAALVDPARRVLLALAQRFDLFDLYRIFLLTVGFAVITSLPPRKTCVPVIAVWLLAGVLSVGIFLTPLREFIP